MDKLSDKFAALRSLPSGLARRIKPEAERPKPESKIIAGLKQAIAHADGTEPARERRINVKASEAVKRSRAKKPEEYRQKHRDYMRKRRAADKAKREKK